jgi:hypothetical protein
VRSIYVDIRAPPQIRPVQIKHELEYALREPGISFQIDVYPTLLGYEGKSV